MNNLKLNGRVPRNAEEEIKITSGVYWNIPVVDSRWYKKDTATRKGIRMNLQEARKVRHMLDKAIRSLAQNEEE